MAGKGSDLVSLTIKGVRREVLDRLRRVASSEGRSLNREVIHLLEQAGEAGSSFCEQTRRQVEAWRALEGRWVGTGTPRAEAHAMMARRSRKRRIDL